ncbi:condensation domain-containing protein [Ruminiclostridium papyrosolvens]|uniref:Alcohol acetyltransferase n=1 Tax=Ruminiclostridium papyrosolvens C7 TaxID=1330534 RepID=U4R243_9FIRM|nr:condensation domain-containing protein [Ruminiclostridium papyrosolvens]EPR12295.1 alcohol acetyltransferase [Ruminiclostridium papyrosolvens C7]
MKFKLKIPLYPSHENINNIFLKFIGINKAKRKKIKISPNCIPADGHDICNYVARYKMANFQIQAVMKLDGRLDFDKLSKAVGLSFDVEPVFGSRFVKSTHPYWKRINDIDCVEFCTFEETDNPDEAIQKFLDIPLDLDRGPMAKVRLIRSGSSETLCMKASHVCCDAAGAKEYFLLLADIYSQIDKENSDYTPVQSIRDKNDQIRLFKALDIDVSHANSLKSKIGLPLWNFPWRNNRIGATRFVVCKLPNGQLEKMKNYSKARGATINDLILTALYRVMFEISKPPCNVPMDIPITLDLRRYLPDQKAEAIRNFAGGYVTTIARKKHESFSETLSRVMATTKKLKDGHPGIENAIWAERVENMNFCKFISYYKASSQIVDMASNNPFYVTNKCGIVLANLGFVSKSPIKFGKHNVTDAYIIPPLVRAPGILLVASTYNGIITLSVGYYKPSVHRSVMEKLLEKIKDELIEGCKQPSEE